jgi:hypothetical protein
MDENSARQQSRNGKLQKKNNEPDIGLRFRAQRHYQYTTVLEAPKRTLQELLGSDRWYGTMPKECMLVLLDRP